MQRLKDLWAWFTRTRPWRAWQRYGRVRGNILAGGVGYFAFFSVFPAVALAFTVFGFVLRGRPDLIQQIADYLNQTLPGFVKDARHPNGIISVQAPKAATLTITGIVSFVTLLLAGMGWLGALRDGIRAVFGAEGAPGNALTTKLRDLGVLLVMGVGIVISAVATAGAASVASWVAERVGLGGQAWIVSVAGILVGVLLDSALMLVLLRLLSGVDLPWRDLRQGALVGGVGFTLLKLLGARLFAGTTSNPLFASVVAVVGLLVWLNLISRVTLLAAAWAANDVDTRALASSSGAKTTVGPVKDIGPVAFGPVTAEQAIQELGMPRDPSLPRFGTRSKDRVTLAAGAVLGATAAFGLSLARGVFSRR
ncbi:MAG TPA: YihY/virulence factor BrkB family protein [Dermatophilaceae bacterium]|nr:YihY/virulence factor BrkB family protein [Dermatophilaceae bacterium]